MPAAVTTTLSQLPDEIKRATEPPRDLKPCLRSMGVYLGSQAKRRFDSGVSPDGITWAPLKRQRNRKRDRRAKGGSGQKVLRDTGLLMASMAASGTAQGGYYDLGEAHLEQGTNLDYAGFHQFGTRNMVARPFAGINDQDGDKLALIAADYFGGERGQ